MAADEKKRRVPRKLRLGLLALGGLLVVLLGAGIAVVATFDPDAQKPRIIAAVKQATGRNLQLNGPIGLKWSLWPTIVVRDAALSNPPGFSRPEMVTLGRAELQLALLPLLSRQVDIQRLVLIDPDIRLETDAQGRPNWVFSPEKVTEPAQPDASTPSRSQAPLDVHIRDVSIRGGIIAYGDGQQHQVIALTVRQLSAGTTGADGPSHLSADLTYDSLPVSVRAEAGSLSRLLDDAATVPWPIRLTMEVAGARATVAGTLTRPMRAEGYDLTVDARIPDTGALTPALTPLLALQGVSANLPAVRDVALTARIADQGQSLPAVTDLRLSAGPSDLGSRYPGVRLDRADIAAPAADKPTTARIAAQVRGVPVSVAATVGHPSSLVQRTGAVGPYPVDVSAQAAGATLTVRGGISEPLSLSGIALNIDARVPDLSALTPVAGRPLPPLKSIALQAHASDPPGGGAIGGTLRGLRLTMPEADVAGDLALSLGTRPALTGVLRAERIDADALLAAFDRPQPATATAGAAAPDGATSPAATTQAATPPASTPPTAPVPQPARSNRVIPDQPIPFDLLKRADADLRLHVAVLRLDGAEFKALDTHVLLRNAVLRLEPVTGNLPQGRLDARVTVDASAPAPLVSVWAQAPGLALRPLLRTIGQPPFANGRLEVYADLRGTGQTPQAIAASLNGTLGLAMADGTIDTRVLGSMLGKVGGSANILDLIGRSGDASEIRCFALRLDARDGILTARPVFLSSSLLTMDGGGTVNLRDETLALILRPHGRVGGTGFKVPLKVSGPLHSPRVDIDATGAAEANAGTLAGIVLGNTAQLGALGALLGGDNQAGGDSGPSCATVLAQARGGQTSSAEAPPPAAARPAQSPVAPQTPPNPGTLLRQLFR